MDKSDKKYIDTKNVDSFKAEFEDYFKNLNEDVDTLTDITSLPTNTVNKVGMALAMVVIGSTNLISIAGLFFKKFWLF